MSHYFSKCPHFFKGGGTLSPILKFLGRTLPYDKNKEVLFKVNMPYAIYLFYPVWYNQVWIHILKGHKLLQVKDDFYLAKQCRSCGIATLGIISLLFTLNS